MDRTARILTSAGFIAGLALLLANDTVLKQAYPGPLTGKVSDFAGLFIFPMFWAALWSRRTREIYIATACAFVWWKSPWSQPAIDGWNDAFAYHITRVVDLTDLIALIALPVSLRYFRGVRYWTHGPQGWASSVVMLASFVAFSGSLFGGDDAIRYDISRDDPTARYELAFPVDSFPERLDATGLFHARGCGLYGSCGRGLGGFQATTKNDTYSISLDNDCREAIVAVTPLRTGVALRLLGFTAQRRCKDGSSLADLRRMFEGEVMPRLDAKAPPKQPTHAPGTSFDYSSGSTPSLELTGSRADIVRRLDDSFSHEFHDGIYQLEGLACYGRFRLDEEPDHVHVVVVGLGYSKPCIWGQSQDCLGAMFRFFISRGEDPTPTPISPPSTSAACISGIARR